MDLQQRSYSTSIFRPKPKIFFENSSQTWIIATSWGESEAAEATIQSLRDQLASISEPDATVIRGSAAGLSDGSNRLVSAARITHQKLFQQRNREEYTTAVELALIKKVRNHLSWVQIGAPALILSTEKGLQPLCPASDLSFQWDQQTPLVAVAMGLHKEVNLHCGSCLVKENDQLILLSKSYIPTSLFQLKSISLQSVSKNLVDENSEQPFWLGLLEF